MVRRTAQFITYGSDTQCLDLMRYLEEAGISLNVRDIEKAPLTIYELKKIIGYCNVYHFLNPVSESFDKHDLSSKKLNRDQVIDLIAKDHTLLRRPIVCTSRLVTIGCDKSVIESVLQLNQAPEEGPTEGNRDSNGMGRSMRPSNTARPSNQHRSSKPSRSSRGGRRQGPSRSGSPRSANSNK